MFLKVTMEAVRTGTVLKSWRKKVPDFRGSNAETAGAK